MNGLPLFRTIDLVKPVAIANLYTQSNFSEIFTSDYLHFGYLFIKFESSLLFGIHHSRYMRSLEMTGY